MYVLAVCKNEEDPEIKVLVCHNIIYQFLICSRAAYSIKGDRIWQKFKLIQPFIGVLDSCKNEEDTSKNGGTRVVTTFLPL